MTVNQPITPAVGEGLSASEIRDRIINPLYQNDQSADSRLALLEAAVAAMPVDHKQDSIPSSALLYDRWHKANGQLYLCNTAYTAGNGDMSKWSPVYDVAAQAAASSAQGTANSATRTILSDTMPSAATEGWLWVDTGNSNLTYSCNATYAEGAGSMSNWSATTDYLAALLAAAQQGLLDGKTNTYFQNDVPEEADDRDGWIDTNDDNAAYACSAGYLSTDGEAWDSGTTYDEDQIAQHDGNLYQSKVDDNLDHEPPNATYWTALGSGYASITEFRESRWVSVTDPVAQAAAAAAQATADGKTYTFYENEWPTAADARDIFHDLDDNETYICISSYTVAFEGDKSTKWTRIQDPVAQARADAAYALADGKVETYVQASIPDSADLKDTWFDSDDDYRMYVCTTAYSAGTGTMEKWSAQTDNTKASVYSQDEVPSSAELRDLWIDTDDNRKTYVCIQAYSGGGTIGVNWLSLSDNKKTTFYQGDPPDAADVGDGWLDTVTPSGQFQFYVCNTTYTEGGHGWTSPSSPGKWTPAKDTNAEALANTAQSTADGKTTTFYQTEMPDAATYADTWVDTDDSKIYVCNETYTSGNGTMGKWDQTTDPVAQSTADAAAALADSKRRTFYSDDVPSATELGYQVDIGDLWCDTDDDYRMYICKEAYSGTGSTDYWQETQDPTARQAALDAAAAVDQKRTTFYTSGAGNSYWPGPGEVNQWPVSVWSSVGGAEIGDIWVHTDTSTGYIYVKYCVEAYDGYADGDMGAMDHWNSWADEASIAAALSSLLPLSGGTMSGNLNMGTHDITNVGAITATGAVGVGSLASTGAVSGTTGSFSSDVGGAKGTFTDVLSGNSLSVTNGGTFGSTVSVGNATSGAHAVNRDTGDGRYAAIAHEGADAFTSHSGLGSAAAADTGDFTPIAHAGSAATSAHTGLGTAAAAATGDFTPAAHAGSAATSAHSGLGTMAAQDSNNVTITGGSISGVTGLLTVSQEHATGTGSDPEKTFSVPASCKLILVLLVSKDDTGTNYEQADAHLDLQNSTINSKDSLNGGYQKQAIPTSYGTILSNGSATVQVKLDGSTLYFDMNSTPEAADWYNVHLTFLG